MTRESKAHELAIAICNALGVDPSRTYGIDIRIRPASLDPNIVSVIVSLDALALAAIDWAPLKDQSPINVKSNLGTIVANDEPAEEAPHE